MLLGPEPDPAQPLDSMNRLGETIPLESVTGCIGYPAQAPPQQLAAHPETKSDSFANGGSGH
jgi:hypothetical protein